MNLDTLSYITDIKGAVSRVQSSQVTGSWVLLGYTDGDEGAKKLNLMTINVIAEGTIWRNLLSSFEDQRIQYAYAKLDMDAKGDMKAFLIHWVGKKVGENEKSSCMPHLNEVRNLIPSYDLLITEMDALEIQSRVHSFLSRAQMICVETRPSRSESNSEIFQTSKSLQRQRVNSNKQEGKERLSLFSSRNNTLSEGLNPFGKARSPTFLEDPEETYQPPQRSPYPTMRRTKFKVAIIGSIGVGKTFIYLSYNDGGTALSAPDLVPSTTHADCMTKRVAIDQHQFSLEIWDTAGQERFMAFAPAWTRNAKVVICVYDITDEDSFADIPKWLETAREFADPRAVYFLVGNKADLDRRIVQVAAAEKLATQHGMCFMECSGLTGYNILKLFESITRRVAFVYQDLLTYPMSKGFSESTIRLPVCDRETSYQGSNSISRHRKKHISCQCN